jgi:hypothetical protein
MQPSDRSERKDKMIAAMTFDVANVDDIASGRVMNPHTNDRRVIRYVMLIWLFTGSCVLV